MNWEILIIVLNLFILESLLSVDNAAVLAVMVRDLPGRQRAKALRYGLIGAYVFRGLCLFLAAWLIKIMWLKILGGLYLLWLAYGHFTKANDTIEETTERKDSKIFKWGLSIGLNPFWATVLIVEIADLAFSIDNVFAAVALSDKFWVIMLGVAIGILAMRFVAGWFVKMLDRYPTLEGSAFVVIGILGLKLVISGVGNYSAFVHPVTEVMESHYFDFVFSALMMAIFFFPLLKFKKGSSKITYNQFGGDSGVGLFDPDGYHGRGHFSNGIDAHSVASGFTDYGGGGSDYSSSDSSDGGGGDGGD
jgi:YkoY family integral membrane protein